MQRNSIDIDGLWNRIGVQSRTFEQSMDTLYRKQTGSYYTALDLTYHMVSEMVNSLPLSTRKDLPFKKFLEPCVGTGNFVFAYLRICYEIGFTIEEYKLILENIYVCDINTHALLVYRNNLCDVAKEWFNVELFDDYFETHIGTGLLFNVATEGIQYIPITDVFPNFESINGFDFVATNPPYKNLKAERVHYANDVQKEDDKKKYIEIANLANRQLKYSTSGTLNLYKLFVEEIVSKYLAPDGVCSLLIPSSILSDKSCAKLRSWLLGSCAIQSIRIFSETSTYVDASQALCALLMHKGKRTSSILIDGSFNGNMGNSAYAKIDEIIDASTGNAILVLTENEYRIRKKMREHPIIRNLQYIVNMRGELDLTLNKEFILSQETKFPFYRGRNIGYYKTTMSSTPEFVSEAFVESTVKKQYINAPRLVCQQIVNMAKKRRISFALVPENSVLGNSCNFISISPNNENVDIYFVYGVLNSSLIDWYFKLTSSNNHINNYEIDNFPIPISYTKKNEISMLVRQYIDENDDSLLQQIDMLVYEAYGLTNIALTKSSVKNDIIPLKDSLFENEESVISKFYYDIGHFISGISRDICLSILVGNASVDEICFEKLPNVTPFEKKVLFAIQEKYRALYNKRILNHTTFKLSDLDLEMIRPIPQGGSWKDIPLETIQKSKRLIRITSTGGRTTLYGRIDYTKPSYTITTYFNRPGNGTYVHPIHNRVLSVREAARFQTFPDDYYFTGNKTDMLKQVGNAVPVLMAYSIGCRIKEKTGCCVSVDLFSGAGGMTLGFKKAKIEAVIANDFSESACITLKANNPEMPVLCGDITCDDVKQRLIEAGKNAGAEIICGGPPCQGFSMAGYRKENDPRNELFRHFIDIVKGVNPKVIVFENVEGILSYQNGETYRNIIELFSELGYHTEGRKLLANHYGVPQRRKRVIILCTRKDIGVLPTELFPDAITPDEDCQVTAFETIADLENIECGENATYGSAYTSPLLQFLKNSMSAEEYMVNATNSRDELYTSFHNESVDDEVKGYSFAKGGDLIQLTLF